MLHHQQYLPPPVRSLFNHLDAALAACDLLLTAQGAAADPHNILRLELTAIAHVLQAREDMREVHAGDGAMRRQIALFLAATGCLEDSTPASGATVGFESAATRLIGGRIDVAALTALTSAMRDLVGLRLLACEDADEDASEAQDHRPRSAVSDGLVWATSPECI